MTRVPWHPAAPGALAREQPPPGRRHRPRRRRGHPDEVHDPQGAAPHRRAARSSATRSRAAREAPSPSTSPSSCATSATRSPRTSPRSTPTAVLADQDDVKGTGRAVECALDALPADLDGTVLVTYGDVPLLTGETLRRLSRRTTPPAAARSPCSRRRSPTRPATAGSCATPTATSTAIVEQKDATRRAARDPRDQLAASSPSTRTFLRDALAAGRQRQRQGRVLPHRRRRHRPRGRPAPSAPTCIDDVWQTEGVNDRVQLAALGRELNRRIVDALDARRGHRHRPGHDLDRRRRRARPRRHDPARHPAARRHRRSARTP